MLHFDKSLLGQDLSEKFGTDPSYKVFRFAWRKGWEQSGAMFKVRFTLGSMNAKSNKVFSLLPMLVLIRFRGFMAKYWLCEEATNRCMGIYYWRTRADAERYSQSIAVKFMTKRSVPGSVSWEITDLGDK